MNISKITPDDPRLTAYALGELEPAEHDAIEAAIKDDPAAQAAVAQIRALGRDLTSALAKEPLPVAPAPEKKSDTSSAHEAYQPRKFIRFPYYIIAGLAAACFAVMFVHQQRVTENGKLAKTKVFVLAGADPAKAEASSTDGKMDAEAGSALYQIELAKDANEARIAAMPALGAASSEPSSVGGKLSEETTTIAGASASKQMQWATRGHRQSTEAVSEEPPMPTAPAFNTEAYAYQADNDYLEVAGNPLSTFSIDVDTASYANMRRFLNSGRLPPRDAVRIEELVNYFPYHYAAPTDKAPFAASLEVAGAPWNPAHRLVRIGLKGREIPVSERPALNLVFLLDVSGSMNEPNKLPLVKESMRLLIEKLRPTDHVAITVYAGASGMVLPSTPASKKQEILSALDELHAGGSTNGALGIQLAYDIAKANFIQGGVNRVVLCTDGDFNIGVTNQGDLTRLIEEKAKSGVFLTVLGFGMGNYKDATLEKLADRGNGNYGYVDNAAEAKKLLADQLSGTLVTIAKDVKLQVEFNPARVKSYRLIGYENRLLRKEDFNNDKIDAGEIGAGHTVTALYEVVLAGEDATAETPSVDPLKYQAKHEAKLVKTDNSPEMLTLKIRYKAPTSDVSSKLEFPLVDSGAVFADATQDFKFAAAVASFGMMLRESPHKGAATFDAVLGWAEDGMGDDSGGYRHEFRDLVKLAKARRG